MTKADPLPRHYHGSIMQTAPLLGGSFRNTPADYFGPGSGYAVFDS